MRFQHLAFLSYVHGLAQHAHKERHNCTQSPSIEDEECTKFKCHEDEVTLFRIAMQAPLAFYKLNWNPEFDTRAYNISITTFDCNEGSPWKEEYFLETAELSILIVRNLSDWVLAIYHSNMSCDLGGNTGIGNTGITNGSINCGFFLPPGAPTQVDTTNIQLKPRS